MRNEQGSLVDLHTVMFTRSITSFLRHAYIQVHNCGFFHVILKNCRGWILMYNYLHSHAETQSKEKYVQNCSVLSTVIQYQWTILNWHVLMTFRNSRTWSLSMWRRNPRKSSSSRMSGHWSTTPPTCTSTPPASSCSPSQPPEEGQGKVWSELIWTWTLCLNMEGVHVVNMCLYWKWSWTWVK